MQLNEYQNLSSRTIDWTLSRGEQEMHALHGMVSEVGELHGIYQKFYQGHLDTDDHRKKEVGDILWFLAEFCTANGWWLEDIAKMNVDKLRARYPDGFDADHSIHRKKGDI